MSEAQSVPGRANPLAGSNRQIVGNFLELINRRGRVREAFERHVSKDYIQHNPAVPAGRDAAIGFIESLVATPGFRASVERMIVEDELVAVHMHVQLGAEALAVIDIWRIEDGKIVEHWDVIQDVPQTTASGNSMF